MSTSDERWRWIPGYEGLYLVSNLGKVMSVPHDVVPGPNTGRIIKAFLCGSGYLKVTLSADGVRAQKSVHRMVAEAFVANPQGKPQVNHIDGNKTNNAASNLEWVTRSENAVHAYRNLSRKKSDYHHSVKLTWSDAAAIRQARGTAASIAKRFGISDVMVLKIKKGECWKEKTCR